MGRYVKWLCATLNTISCTSRFGVFGKELINLIQYLPKPERRRGLLNLGGNFLKMLFGTATVADLHGLHIEVDVMRKNEEIIVH